MVNNLSMKDVLDPNLPLVEFGIALHWLRPQHKAPIAKDWSEQPRAGLESLRRSYVQGANVGWRLGEVSETSIGFLHLFDVDIRKDEMADEAMAAVRAIYPGIDKLPSIISGSGGASRHFVFFTDKPFRSKKLLKSDGFEMVWDDEKGRDVKKFDWEIEFFGTGKQAVIPPSIHPVTKKPYVWERGLDLSMASLGIGPTIPSSVVEGWGARADDFTTSVEDDDMEDMADALKLRPLGLTDEEVDDLLSKVPDWWVDDRDQWFYVGMALHHEYEGSAFGFEKWCDWSSQSSKYDKGDQERVWKSFKNRTKRPLRMAYLISEVRNAQLSGLESNFEDVKDAELLPPLEEPKQPVDPLLSDLLGTPAPETDTAITLLPPQVHNTPMPRPEAEENWWSNMARNEDGVAKNSAHNCQLVVRNDPRLRGVFAYNEMLESVRLVNDPTPLRKDRSRPKPIKQLDGPAWQLKDRVNGDALREEHFFDVKALCETPETQEGLAMTSVPAANVRGAIISTAMKFPFNPAQDRLSAYNTGWDGKKGRIERLFIDYLGAEDNIYHREIGRLWMIAIVARTYEPGCKFDWLPVLEGAQGRGKSLFCRIMAVMDAWFTELPSDLNDANKLAETIEGKMIVEMGEMAGMSKVDSNHFKGFVTKQSDRRRKPYAPDAIDYPRRCVLIGTTNDQTYLRDQTGNRRFMPIRCGETFRLDLLRQHLPMLYGEAVHEYREMRRQCNGELPLYLQHEDAQKIAAQLQNSRLVETEIDALTGQVQEWLDQPIGSDFEDIDGNARYHNEVFGKMIWEDCLGRREQFDYRAATKMNQIMEKLVGWTRADQQKRFKGYGKQRYFYRDISK